MWSIECMCLFNISGKTTYFFVFQVRHETTNNFYQGFPSILVWTTAVSLTELSQKLSTYPNQFRPEDSSRIEIFRNEQRRLKIDWYFIKGRRYFWDRCFFCGGKRWVYLLDWNGTPWQLESGRNKFDWLLYAGKCRKGSLRALKWESLIVLIKWQWFHEFTWYSGFGINLFQT